MRNFMLAVAALGGFAVAGAVMAPAHADVIQQTPLVQNAQYYGYGFYRTDDDDCGWRCRSWRRHEWREHREERHEHHRWHRWHDD